MFNEIDIICPICGHELIVKDEFNNRNISCSNTQNCNFSCNAPLKQKIIKSKQTTLTSFKNESSVKVDAPRSYSFIENLIKNHGPVKIKV